MNNLEAFTDAQRVKLLLRQVELLRQENDKLRLRIYELDYKYSELLDEWAKK